MEKIVVEIITILVGLSLILFRKQFVGHIIDFQQNVLNIHEKTDKKAQAGLRTLPIFGAGLILVGIWNLAKVIL